MIEIEERVLSALFHIDTIGTVLSELEPDDLEDQLARDVFTAIQELFNEGTPVEPLSVLKKLEHVYANTEGLEKMCRYFAAEEPINYDYCIKALQDSRRFRRIHDLAVRLELSESIADAEEIIQSLSFLSVPRTKGMFQTGQQAASSFMDTLNDRIENGVEFIKWGLYPLDNNLHTRSGNLVVFGARPSTGKSALALQCALYMAKAGHRVGFVSLEMGAEEINERVISHLSGVPLDMIVRGKLSDADVKKICSACELLYKLPIGFDYSARTVAQIQAKALSERWEVCFVDYLQLMNGGKGTRYEQVTEISQSLQNMAHKNRILTVALSQLSRPQRMADGQERKPNLTDLRESGQVEQDADAVILLSLFDSRDKNSDRYVQLAKNRQGRCCDFRLRFHGEKQTFEFLPSP